MLTFIADSITKENILIILSEHVPLLCDFGMARVQRNMENSTSGLPISSSYPGFIPPEKYERRRADLTHRSEMTADVWASGMMLLWIGLRASKNHLHYPKVLKSLSPAFQLDEGNPSQLQAKNALLESHRLRLKLIFFSGMSHNARLELWDIICGMLVFTISKRPSIGQVFDRISNLEVT